MAVGDRTRTCYLRFSPDHYILGCPQLNTQQKDMAHQKRLAFSQIEKPFGSVDVPYGLNKPAGQPYGQTQQLTEKPNGHGNKSFWLPTRQINRSYGQPYGYSRPLASNRVYSDDLPPFRRAVWEGPTGGGDRRNAETTGSSVNYVEAQQVPTEREPVGSVHMESE
jgi:hypothetical protein